MTGTRTVGVAGAHGGAAFDVGAHLPLGQATLIEASAGTGKTYALTAICVRFVAEHGIPIDRILLVTFTRAATAELRDRVRSRLVEAEAHLARPELDPHTTDDPLLAALGRRADGSACGPEERELRRSRLARAVSDFDTATISTIHGFCSQVRASIGVLSEHSNDTVPTQSETDLITEVCADLFFRELSRHDTNPFGTRSLSDIVALVSKARTLAGAEVVANSGLPTDVASVKLVADAVEEVELRLRRQGGQSFDSLLVNVRDALDVDERLVEALRDQFPVALIDEFQDTDPVQWAIFRKVFADGVTRSGTLPRALFLVGDPKQAIYSFRGGDIYTYLQAKAGAEVRALTTNHRSDPSVVEAMNRLAGGHRYGDADIAYQQVEHSSSHASRRAVDRSTAQPLPGMAVRVLEPSTKGNIPTNAAGVRRAIAGDLAGVVVDLLTNAAVEADGDHRPVAPSDIAVLVGATSEARPVATALRAAGVPVVLRLRDDVADSDARHQWRTLLHALDRPGSVPRAAAAAVTWFFGWSPQLVAESVEAAADDTEANRRLLELQQTLADWSTVLSSEGIAALYGRARQTRGLAARLLATDTGERDLTDLEHLAELIHSEARAGGRDMSAGTALEILDQLGGTPEDEVAADAAQRRIDSDSDSVQVMTIHGSKGLEFPFVLLPYLYAGGARVGSSRPYVFYDAAAGHRVIDISAASDPATGESRGDDPTPEEASARDRAKDQACGDQHRLTYVALTRAMHQTVLWWSSKGTGLKLSGVSRMLFGDGTSAASAEVALPKANKAFAAVGERVTATNADAVVAVEELDRDVAVDPAALPDPPPRHDGITALASLDVALLGRPLDRLRRVWSFSSMAKDLHTALPVYEPGDPVVVAGDDIKAQDEPPRQNSTDSPAGEAGSPSTGATGAPAGAPSEGPADAPAGTSNEGARSGPGPGRRRDPEPTESEDLGDWDQPSPFTGLGGGKDFGNLVHHVLEVIDFTAIDLEREIAAVLDRPIGHRVGPEQRDRLPVVLAEVIRTPLGSPFEDLRLADLAPTDRLNELTFHFSLAPRSPISAGLIGAVVAAHLPETDPLHRWARSLERGLSGLDLQGYLNGSIDLTLRQAVGGAARYSVVDYKTNNLAPGEAVPTLQSYRSPHTTRAMADNQYALQALLYSVALHRYLRWRLPDYDPTVHLGPVGYLFVRGMVGRATPSERSGGATFRSGVFSWAVPPGLVSELSALFTGHTEAGGHR